MPSDLDAISFGTDGWRAHRSAFTDDRVAAVANGFMRYLAEAVPGGDTIAVGFDARVGADDIAEMMAGTFTDGGYDVWLADRDCPTPAVATVVDRCDLAGGVMVTASHNPPAYNGIKLIPAGGAPALPSVTDTVEANLTPPTPVVRGARGHVDSVDYVDHHIETVLDRVAPDLAGQRILYDAMHGSGRGVTDEILERAGATVDRIRSTRTPDFGGSAPEPTPANLTELVGRLADGPYDLGVANDGDADRVAVVEPSGYVDANHLFAVLYADLLERDSGPAVRTVSTTFLIDRIAEAHGEIVHETPVGFKWVAETMAEVDALIGGEDSGGFTVRGHVREKDGPLAAALAADADRSKPMTDRLAEIEERYGEVFHRSVSVPCEDDLKPTTLANVAAIHPDRLLDETVAETNQTDGVKFLLAGGSWVLVRPSGTEPVMRVYAEAPSAERADALVGRGAELVRAALGGR